MENNTTPSKSYFQFGIVYGILMVLAFVLIYVSNVDIIENPSIGMISSIANYFILPIIFIYFGCVNFKNSNDKFISLSECLKVGVSILFIGALIFSVFNIIFNIIFPEYLEEILSQTRHIMLKSNPNLTSEQLEMAISMSRKFASPIFSVPITLLMFSFLGLIYSLIIGLIIKRDRPQSI